MKPVSAKADDTSVLSGKSMKALSAGEGRVWRSNRSEPKSFKARIAALAEAAEKKPAGAPASRRTATRKAAGGRSASRSAKPKLRAKQVRSTQSIEQRRTGASDSASERSNSALKPKRGNARSGKTVADEQKNALTPEFIEPMKAQLVDAPPPGDWLYEIKFDGFRAIALRDLRGTRLLSRNNKDFADRFPEVVAAMAALDVNDAVVDGEVVALDDKGRSSFQLLQAPDLGDQRPPIFYYVFDLLQLNGRKLGAMPLTARKAELERLVTDRSGVIRFSASLGQDAVPLLEQARKLGLEGLIGKRPDSLYEPGRRSGNWIKLKLHREQEFVIGGYTPPGGSRLHFGALLVGVYEHGRLRFAGKVGTGFDAKLLRALHAKFKALETDSCPFVDLPEARRGRYGQGMTAAEMRRCPWLRPVMVCQLKFTEWTRGGHLRHPVFLGLRDDKAATEVIREDHD